MVALDIQNAEADNDDENDEGDGCNDAEDGVRRRLWWLLIDDDSMDFLAQRNFAKPVDIFLGVVAAF